MQKSLYTLLLLVSFFLTPNYANTNTRFNRATVVQNGVQNVTTWIASDSTPVKIQCKWAREPYVPDGSLNHVEVIEFYQKNVIQDSFDVLHANPFFKSPLVSTEVVKNAEGHCYNPDNPTIEKAQQESIFYGADNVLLSCPIVKTNKDFALVIYNAACRVAEHPFRYLSNILVLDSNGREIYDTGILERSVFQLFLSNNGEFAFYVYEAFGEDVYYPSIQDIDLLYIPDTGNMGANMKEVFRNANQRVFLITNDNNGSSTLEKLVVFDTKTYRLATIETDRKLSSYTIELVDNAVVVKNSSSTNAETASYKLEEFHLVEVNLN